MEISHRSKKKGSCNYPFFVLLSLHFLSSHLRMIWLITLAMIEVTMEIITSTGIHLLPVVRRLSDNVYIVTQQRIWIEKSIKCIILHFNVKYISVCRYENRPLGESSKNARTFWWYVKSANALLLEKVTKLWYNYIYQNQKRYISKLNWYIYQNKMIYTKIKLIYISKLKRYISK